MEGPQRFELMGQTPQKEKKKKKQPTAKTKAIPVASSGGGFSAAVS